MKRLPTSIALVLALVLCPGTEALRAEDKPTSKPEVKSDAPRRTPPTEANVPYG
jgi:hypothetical protein